MYVPADWNKLLPDELCLAQPIDQVAGPDVYCGLTKGHGGKMCYSRELHWHFYPKETANDDG